MEKDHIEYPWQQAVVNAFLAQPRDLAGKIHIAERAIQARLRGPEKISPAEHLALEDALRSLRVLIVDLRSQDRAQSERDEEEKRFG